MINLLNFVSENSRMNSLISKVSEVNGHQGTVIRFADDFLVLFNLWKNDPWNFRYLLDYYFEDLSFRRFMGDIASGDIVNRLGGLYPLNTYTGNIDFSEWTRFNQEFSKNHPNEIVRRFFRPLELIVSIYNDADPRVFENILYNDNEDGSNNNLPKFRVIIEKRRRNVFLSGSRKFHSKMIGGISISDNSSRFGTLGGILTDSNGNYFGLTCAHVANTNGKDVFQPALSDSKKYRKFGNVDYASAINWTKQDSPCNPRYIGQFGIDENIDTSLIAIDSNVLCEKRIHNLGKVSGEKRFSEIHQHMEVEFNGRSTGSRKKLAVGGICVSYKIAYEGEENEEDKFACFRNLIELRTPAPIINAGNFHVQRSPVAHGDSGSWICSNDRDGYNWCGMLISGDVDRGYFLAAEDIQNHLRNNNYKLSCTRVNIDNSP